MGNGYVKRRGRFVGHRGIDTVPTDISDCDQRIPGGGGGNYIHRQGIFCSGVPLVTEWPIPLDRGDFERGDAVADAHRVVVVEHDRFEVHDDEGGGTQDAVAAEVDVEVLDGDCFRGFSDAVGDDVEGDFVDVLAHLHDDLRVDVFVVFAVDGGAADGDDDGVLGGVFRADDLEHSVVAGFHDGGVAEEDLVAVDGGRSRDVEAVRGEGAGLDEDRAVKGGVAPVGDGDFQVVREATLHLGGGLQDDSEPIQLSGGGRGVVCVVHVELRVLVPLRTHLGAIAHGSICARCSIVHRVDGHRDGGPGHEGEVDGAVRVRTTDTGSAEEEAKGIVYRPADVFVVFLRSEAVVEADGVAVRDEVELEDGRIVHGKRRNGLQVGIAHTEVSTAEGEASAVVRSHGHRGCSGRHDHAVWYENVRVGGIEGADLVQIS